MVLACCCTTKELKTYWRKDSLFSKWCWENWLSTFRELKVDPCFSPFKKVSSKKKKKKSKNLIVRLKL
jgi:hypothetical protein